MITFARIVMISASWILIAQHCSSQTDSTTWVCSADIGFFPTAYFLDAGWYPTCSVRGGIGTGNSTFSAHVFVDYYSFRLSETGGNHWYLERGAQRQDIAVYPAIRLFRFFFVGLGLFATRSDHVTITSFSGQSPWGGGDARGIRLFYIVGLGWDLRVSDNVRLPFGIYYRNTGYYPSYSSYPMLAIRAGISVQLH
jgi:hypothetical protein